MVPGQLTLLIEPSPPHRLEPSVPATRTVTITAVALLALTTGCGGTSARKPPGAATFGLTSPTPASSDRPTPATSPTSNAVPGTLGGWTSAADLPVPVTNGTVIAGVTGSNNRVQALDAMTGRALWDVPLPLTGGASPGAAPGTAGPVLLAAPGASLVLTVTQGTAGSGLTPASTQVNATALDPGSGRVLWTEPGPANFLNSAAVLTGSVEFGTAGATATALDPNTGKARWTRPGAAVGVDGNVAVLSLGGDGGLSTVLTGTDTNTGRTLWSSADWARGAEGSRSTLLATGAGHALIETTRSDLAGDTTSLRVRDLRTGQAIGPEVPQPSIPTSLTDMTTGVAVVYEKVPDGATTGPYGLDMRTGKVLWHLTLAQSAKADAVGGGLAWVDGADGYVALDDRTGKPRTQKLADYPLLALKGEQIKAGPAGLVATPLPG